MGVKAIEGGYRKVMLL